MESFHLQLYPKPAAKEVNQLTRVKRTIFIFHFPHLNARSHVGRNSLSQLSTYCCYNLYFTVEKERLSLILGAEK